MKQPPSLLIRIILRLSMTTVVAIVFAYGWLWWEFESTTGSLRDTSLILTARGVADAIRPTDDGGLKLNMAPKMMDVFVHSEGKNGFAVRDRASGDIVFAAGAAVGPIPEHVDEDDDGSLYRYNPDGPGPTSYFGEALQFEVKGRLLLVQVVEFSGNYQDLIETVLADFFEDGGWLAGPFLLVILGVSILTVRGTLSPLLRLSHQAEAIGPATTDLRLPLVGVPREILPLVKAVNSAFDRLDRGFRLQREFTADAAHELRTPLAILQAHVDTLADRETAKELAPDIDAMTHLVEQLLRVAQAESLELEFDDKTELCGIARDVAKFLAPIAVRAGRTVEVDAPDHEVWVNGRHDFLFHAVRNLADNALRHTPEGTSVIVGVAESPPQLTVRDWGAGVQPDSRDAIFRRFWRADRRVGGAGLGLSIVQRTMHAHGGDVVCEDAAGGGALFRLVFPRR